jgi:hypothetical protein
MTDTSLFLRVKKTIYGTIQAAMCFWRVLTKAFSNMGYTRCATDPCLHFKWTDAGLSLFASHVDNNLIVGCDNNVKLAKRLLQDELDCEDIGQLKEYLGCKIDYDHTKGRMQITQPVLLQSFIDEFDLPDGAIPHTPAVPGSTLTKHPDDQLLDGKAALKYRSGVGKLLYMSSRDLR